MLGFFEPLIEQRGAPLNGGGRVVQFMGDAGGELSERDESLVVQILGRELPRAIEHLVHQDRGHSLTLSNHFREISLRYHERRRWLLGHGVTRRGDHARVRKY